MSVPAENLNRLPTLASLLEGYADVPSIDVLDVTLDSRQVCEGCVFLAVQGLTRHGIEFAQVAIERGAAAIVYDSATAGTPGIETDIPVIGVDGLAGAIGEISNRFFARPSADLAVFGVTGTNGKSTVAWMLAQALTALGEQTAYSGTLGQGLGRFPIGESMTSPDVIELNRRLDRFRSAGATAAAIEVSSHALDQGRVDGIEFAATVLTNLSRDHLDYHGDMQAYADAKAQLFFDCPALSRIVNIDSEFGRGLADRLGDAAVTVSVVESADLPPAASVEACAVAEGAAGSRVGIRSIYGNANFLLPMPGRYNVANAALVIASLCARGSSLDEACAALAGIEAPPGRMQRVPGGENAPSVFVDYAHTPDALDVALTALREHAAGQLWCVFGCGGDRDAGKRPLMAQIAERCAGHLVITNDNPRTEDPQAILADIAAGLEKPDAATVIEDRGEAIAWAVANAAADDVVLIAGKGHEDYQLVGEQRLSFSDFESAAASLDKRQPPEAT